MIKSLPLTALSLTLGFFFVFVGLLKLTPNLNPDMHEDLKQEFGRFNKVFPLYSITGWKPYARNYRLFTGTVEFVCGLVLILIPGSIKNLATMILINVMVGALYTHYALNDKFERIVPVVVFTLLLICRLVISYQVDKRDKLEDQNVKMEKLVEEEEKNK